MAVYSRFARYWGILRSQRTSPSLFRIFKEENSSGSGFQGIMRKSYSNEKFEDRMMNRNPWIWLSVLGGMALGSQPLFVYSDHNGEAGSAAGILPPKPVNDNVSSVTGSFKNIEEMVMIERKRIEDALKSKGLRYGHYPRFSVGVKGQKVTVKFEIPSGCDVAQLIANLSSSLGATLPEGGGSEMTLRAWDSAAAWQLTLSPSEKQQDNEGVQSAKKTDPEDRLCILFFRSILTYDKAEMEFIKHGSLNASELDALVSAMELASERGDNFQKSSIRNTPKNVSAYKSVAASLESMGIRIYGLEEPFKGSSRDVICWDNIAGYGEQKREIEDTILLTLQSPEVYDDIARGTRRKFESNKPRAVLFEGPPGTGKTSSARVIASQAGVPLLYVPLEVVMSKYYGESERLLGKVFSLANELPDGGIIFLDEVDSFAVARDNEMHEATRRMLSVILRQIDGFEQNKKVVVIAATNRKQDLDPALISRFDSMIVFGLPDQQTRQDIAAQYAKQLTKSELEELGRITEGMSGRDIKDICQRAERSWASKIIRGQVEQKVDHRSLPPAEEYMESAMNRRNGLSIIKDEGTPRSRPRRLAV